MIRIVANLHQDIVKFPLARLISSACLRVRSNAEIIHLKSKDVLFRMPWQQFYYNTPLLLLK